MPDTHNTATNTHTEHAEQHDQQDHIDTPTEPDEVSVQAEETTIEVAEPILEPDDTPPLPYGLVPIWIGVTIMSFLIYRFGKLRVAERVKRWLPTGHVILWGIGIALSTVVLVRTESIAWLLCGALVFAALIFLNSSWLKSILAGIALTLEHHLEIGDSVRLDGLEGDIVHFGLRSTRLRAVDGTLHDIPHEHLLTQRVANLSGDGSDSACKIGIQLPEGANVDLVMAQALEIAILSPLASPRHKPEVFLESTSRGEAPSMIYIKGYAFDPNYQEHFRSDVLKRLHQKIDTSS